MFHSYGTQFSQIFIQMKLIMQCEGKLSIQESKAPASLIVCRQRESFSLSVLPFLASEGTLIMELITLGMAMWSYIVDLSKQHLTLLFH